MNPKKIVRLVTEFVKGKNPDVKVNAEHELPAYQGKTTGPYADAIRDEPSYLRVPRLQGPISVRNTETAH